MNIFTKIFGNPPKKIDQAQTAIENYHSNVKPNIQTPCRKTILNSMEQGKTYTIGEIAEATGLEKSSVSARRYELLAEGKLLFSASRKCTISDIMCQTVRLP